jgi:hypothetical protein
MALFSRYSGNDLKNAACYDRNGLPPYSATIHSMIGAMAMHNFESCYKCMKITNKQNHKSVVVKIVDKCAGKSADSEVYPPTYPATPTNTDM